MSEPISPDPGPVTNPFQPAPDPFPDDQDVCRVCRVEGDDDEPLIYPCKCAGSVRYVHPTCLRSWLAASGKRFCEICGYKYAFTKGEVRYLDVMLISVYPEHVPSSIPLQVYIRQTIRGFSRLFSHATRLWACIIGWLIILPSVNMTTLRSLVWLADALARPEPFATNFTISANTSAPLLHRIDFSLKHWYMAEDNTLPGFVFRGQILSITLAGVLLGLVLVREWIQQHNWTENLHPDNDTEDINPDEWMVRRGIAVKLSDLFKDVPPVPAANQAVESPVANAPLFHTEVERHVAASTTETAPSSSSNTSASSGTPPRSTEETNKATTLIAPPVSDIGDDEGRATSLEDGNGTGAPTEDNDEDYEDEDEDVVANQAAARPNGAAPAHLAYVAPEMLENLANEWRQRNARDPLMDAHQLEDLLRRMELHLQPDAQPAADAAPAAQQGRDRRHRQQDAGVDEWGDELEEPPFEREDWDGILEVIGLIGPWQNLFQNVIFAIIIMGAALTILVGIPIIVGKIWLTLNMAQTTYKGARTLLRLVRLFADPVINICIEIVRDVVLNPMISSFQAMERIAVNKLHLPVSTSSSLMSGKLDAVVTRFGTAYEAQRQISARIAGSSSIPDRVWCMVVGYAVVIFAVVVIAVAGEANLGRLSTGVADQLQQNSKFLKLAMFMALEMAMFPIVAGGAINFSLIPVFEGATVESRLAQIRSSPFSSVFVCWVIGTSFMYAFSSFLSYIRSTLRPGTIYFIRDPSDQSYSPVKDILERPTMSQLRKLSISAVIYCFVIFCLFGASTWLVRYYSPIPILPLRLSAMPLTSVPFDLLFLHLVVPPTAVLVRPKHKAKRLWNTYWQITTRAFALSHLMYGPDNASSPTEKKHGGWTVFEAVWPVLDSIYQLVFGRYDPAATEARVPSTDRVALLTQKERQQDGVFVPLDAAGTPRTDQGKLALLKQDRKARQAKRDPRKDYQVIWLPRYWRTRIHAFVFTALGMASAILAVALFAPLLVGRAALGMFASDMHDGYSYVVGAYVCLLAGSIGRSVGQRITRSAYAARLRRSDSSTRFKRGVVGYLSAAYASIVLFLVLPGLVGLVFELYIVLPAKYGLRDVAPVLHAWDIWANGTILLSIFAAIMSSASRRRALQRTVAGPLVTQVRDVLRAPFSTGFKRLNVTMARTGLVLMFACAAPSSAVLFVVNSLPERYTNENWNRLTVRWLYPLALTLHLLVTFREELRSRLRVLRQKMIDAEYVVEERVENYDPNEESVQASKESPTPQRADAEDEDEDQWVDEGEGEGEEEE